MILNRPDPSGFSRPMVLHLASGLTRISNAIAITNMYFLISLQNGSRTVTRSQFVEKPETEEKSTFNQDEDAAATASEAFLTPAPRSGAMREK